MLDQKATKIRRTSARAGRLFLLASLLAIGSPGLAQTPKPHTIERLYSLPRLIGTAPSGFSWSKDSRQIAFLWNDEGDNFRDVWVADVSSGEPSRVTRLARLAPGDPGSDEALRAERDRGVSEVSWHPDGTRLLFAFRGDFYLVEPGSEPRRLTSTSGAESSAVFAVDGSSLVYLLDGDLWSRSVDPAGRASNLTSWADQDVSVHDFSLAPDGLSVAFVETNRSRVPVRSIPDYLLPEPAMGEVKRPYPGDPSESYRLGIVSSSGSEPRFVDLGSRPMDPIFSYRWSPDSASLLVDTSDLYVKDRRVLVVTAASGAVVERIRERNPSNVQAGWQVEWDPDGSGFYFLSDRDEDTHIYRLALEGGTPERVTRGDWTVSSFALFDHGLAFVGNEGRPEERHVFIVDPASGSRQRVSQRAGLHQPTYSPDGRFAVDFFSSDETPFDAYLLELTSTPEPARRLTRSPLPEFEDYRWVAPEYVTFESHVDGVTLSGRLTVPPDLDRSRKHPAILGSVYSNSVRNQWGGRTAHPTWGLDQYLVQEGYVLLNIDFRGSAGHGKSFRQGIRLDYGGIDVEDLHSGVKFLETLGFVDMDRVGIWGSSYGGLLTCMSLFKKPGVYKAGVAGAPATNVWHAMTGEKRVMMEPEDQPEAYANASAITHAEGLRDPLMILHGMRDRIVLFQDSVVLVETLMRLGKDVDLVALPNSGHGWDNEGLYQTRFAFRKLISHFERYLGKGPTEP